MVAKKRIKKDATYAKGQTDRVYEFFMAMNEYERAVMANLTYAYRR